MAITPRRRRKFNPEKVKRLIYTLFHKSKYALLSQYFWISAITISTFIAAIFFLYPRSKKISAPAIVAASDVGELIPLKVTILNKRDIVLRFDLYHFLFRTWTRASVQKVKGCKDIKLVINGVSSKNLNPSYLDSIFIDKGDNYINIERGKLEKYFNLNGTHEFYIEYTFIDGLYSRSYSSSFISLLYIPVDYNTKVDDSLSKETEIQLETPHNYIVTSSIPDAEKIFVLESGVNYSFKYNRKETGILISLEDLSATGLKDIIMLFVTTVFGFALGLLIEKWLQQGKKDASQSQ